MLTVLDLFSGIGGLSLGLESTGGFHTIAFCEVDPFCREVLAACWPGVTVHDDVRRLGAAQLVGQRVDVIAGGFPCQDISVAGKGVGIDGARSGLWAEMFRLVCELRPRLVLAENVPALRTRGADRVLADLEGAGYACRPFVVGAWAVGAPHRRDRVWIVARRVGLRDGAPEDAHAAAGRPRDAARESGGSALAHGDERRREGERIEDGDAARELDGEPSRHVADGRGERPVGEPTGQGLALRGHDGRGARAQDGASAWADAAGAGRAWPARPGEPQHEWEEPRLAYGGLQWRRTGETEVTRQGSEACDCGHDRDAHQGGADEDCIDCSCIKFLPRRLEQPLGSPVDGLPIDMVQRLADRSGMARAEVAEWWTRNRFKVERRQNREALKAAGNSVVPQVVAAIGRAILAAEGLIP